MNAEDIKQKIIKHMKGLHKIEELEDMDKVMRTLAERYDTPLPVVRKVIAEWQAGEKISTKKKD